MNLKEMDKHMIFLNQYSIENKILFRVNRSGITVEDISERAIEIRKGSK